MSALVAMHMPNDAQTAAITALVRDETGIALGAGRGEFLRSRLAQRLRESGCADFAAYLARLRGPSGPTERVALIEALATHTTGFFREQRHFDWLATEGLAGLVAGGAGRTRPLVAWSAACSTGAEMWSTAMVLDAWRARERDGERDGGAGLDWAVLGSDVSRRILRRAATAVFGADEIEGVPEDMRRRYLMRARPRQDAAVRYRIVPELRERARLFYANLIDLDTAPPIRADAIFLRNVLIYFEAETRRRVVEGVTTRLAPGGVLMTGHAEALDDAASFGLAPIAPSIYRKERSA